MGESWEKRRLESGLEREKYYFFDSNYQNVRFLFQMVSYDEESLTWVFCLSWKCLKNQIWDRKEIDF
jgi:hypothetical protein